MTEPEVHIECLCGFGAFRDVMTNGRVAVEKPLRIFLLPTTNEHNSVYVGYAVSRAFRRAVDRNRLKRLMREAFRLHQGMIETAARGKEGMRIIFLFSARLAVPVRRIRLEEIAGAMETLLAGMCFPETSETTEQ